MKSHKYWSLGALFCMLGCIYSGIKKSMTAHKYFAYSSLLCMGMSIYSGHKLVSPKKKKITKSNNSENNWTKIDLYSSKTTRGPFPGLGSGPLDLCCYIAFCCAVKAASGGGRLLPPGTYYNKESHSNDLTFQNELVGPVLNSWIIPPDGSSHIKVQIYFQGSCPVASVECTRSL